MDEAYGAVSAPLCDAGVGGHDQLSWLDGLDPAGHATALPLGLDEVRAMIHPSGWATAPPEAMAVLSATREIQGCTLLAEAEAATTEAEFRLAPYEDDDSSPVAPAASALAGWATAAAGLGVSACSVAPMFRQGWETGRLAGVAGRADDLPARPDAHAAPLSSPLAAAAVADLPSSRLLVRVAAAALPELSCVGGDPAEGVDASSVGPDAPTEGRRNAAAEHPVAATLPLGPRPLLAPAAAAAASVWTWELDARSGDPAPSSPVRLCRVEVLGSTSVGALSRALASSAPGMGPVAGVRCALVCEGAVYEDGPPRAGPWLRRWAGALSSTPKPSGMGLVVEASAGAPVSSLRPRLLRPYVLLASGPGGAPACWFRCRCVDARERCPHDDPREEAFPRTLFRRVHSWPMCELCLVRPGQGRVPPQSVAWLPAGCGSVEDGAVLCRACFRVVGEAGALGGGW